MPRDFRGRSSPVPLRRRLGADNPLPRKRLPPSSMVTAASGAYAPSVGASSGRFKGMSSLSRSQGLPTPRRFVRDFFVGGSTLAEVTAR